MTSDPLVRVACVIPAFRAEATVGGIVRALRRALPRATIIGVDDGSADGTARRLRLCADDVIVMPTNRGKGAALRAGFDRAVALGADAIVSIDADGQHDAALAPALLAALAHADLVLGARRRSGAMPLGRRVTNGLSNAAVARLSGHSLPDTQSGFRAVRAAVVRAVRPAGDRYEFETEFLLMAARRGFRIATVPVPTVYGGGAPSHFRPVRDGLRVARSFWRFSLDAAR